MTTELCAEEVVVRLSSPQPMSTETVVTTGTDGVAGVPRAGRGGGGVELGRRLLLAARAGDTPAVLDLMAQGAPFTTDWLGTSPLHLAAANEHVETCAVLLRAGVSRDARTKTARTPLHLAAHAGATRAARLLLRWGARADARDLLRMTPLHWACARGHAHIARALLQAGADPRAACKFRKTPRQHAARARHTHLLALLDAALAEEKSPEPPMMPDPEPDIETLPRVQEFRPTRVRAPVDTAADGPQHYKIPTESGVRGAAGVGGAGGGSAGMGGAAGAGGAAALLRRHGITLLPADDGSTVLNALQSGRTIVLSDAGKLMLKESSTADAAVGEAAGAVTTAGRANAVGGACTAGVGGTVGVASVVGAAGETMRASLAPGVKVFTLNNKQVKFVQLPSDARLGPAKGVGKAKTRPAVKIIMNKANFGKLLANANKPQIKMQTGESVEPVLKDVEMAHDEPEDCAALKAELRAARAEVAALAAELRECRARLARHEADAR